MHFPGESLDLFGKFLRDFSELGVLFQQFGQHGVFLGGEDLSLLAGASEGFTVLGIGFSVAVDRPFAGALVPLRWYGRDARVSAVMLEVQRGLYCNERTGQASPSMRGVSRRLERAVAEAVGGL